MGTILTYDSETTKLVDFKLPSEDPSQPYITELAAKLIDVESREVMGCMNTLIYPEGWEIGEEAAEKTGITMDLLRRYGVPLAQALELFVELWQKADVRVAHNESFDMRVFRTAFKRDQVFKETKVGELEFADHWKAEPAFCTQTNSTKIINLPPTERMVAKNMKGPKSPNLGEAYEFFTGQPLVGAHRAMADVDACTTVYFGIKDWIAAHPQ